ncbi:MAG: hypothetical protein AVDCRST_MAG17-23, partial [uncultured Solirubrobacterales bacterium]
CSWGRGERSSCRSSRPWLAPSAGVTPSATPGDRASRRRIVRAPRRARRPDRAPALSEGSVQATPGESDRPIETRTGVPTARRSGTRRD